MLRRLGALLGTLVLFVLSVMVGVFIHANTPGARRLAMSEVNTILAPSFQGQIRIDDLGSLGLFGLSDANLSILDPSGRPVLVARGVRVRVATFDAVRSVFEKKAPLTVTLSDVSIDTLDVRLDTDHQGQLDLVDTFNPRTPSPPTPTDPNARGFRLAAPHIAWRHAWAHGRMAGVPAIDADVDELRGKLDFAPDALQWDVFQAKLTARRIADDADVTGALRAHVIMPSEPKKDIDARADWAGVVAGIEHTAHGSFAGNRVVAVVDVPPTDAAHLRALWPASPIEQPVRAHIEANGPLTDIALGAHAELGGATLQVLGNISVGDDKTAKLSIEACNIDIHQLAASAPTSRLGLTGKISADMKADGALTGNVALRFLGGKIGKNAVPSATLDASGSMTAARALNANATVVVDEPGAPTQLRARAFPRGTSSAVAFQLDSKSIDLDRVPELGHAVRGSFGVSATGEFDVGAMTIDARLHAKADGIVQGTTRVASAAIVGRAQGPVASPRMDVSVLARDVVAGGLRFTSASVDAVGSAMAPHVTVVVKGPDTPDVDASVDLGLEGGISLDALRVALARKGERAVVTARTVKVTGGDVRVDGARIEGVGEPMTASVTMSPGTLRVVAGTQGIDLARVARLGNLEKNLKGGTLSFDTDLRLQREGAQGRVKLDVVRASVGSVKNVSAHVEATFDGRKVVGKAHADADTIVSVDIDAPKVELASGSALSMASWRQAWGTLDVDASADLDRLSAVIPPEDHPLSRARGTVHVKGHLSRDDIHDFTPDLTLSVSTDKLEIAGKTPVSTDIDGVIVYPPPAWHVEGIDVVLEAKIDGKSGDIQVSTKAYDIKGPLAQLDVGSKQFPFAEAIHDSAKLTAMLRTTPVDLHLVVPERGLGTVPDILKQSVLVGKLQADVKATGTLMAPRLDVTAAIRHPRR
jgi:hypothetical protein